MLNITKATFINRILFSFGSVVIRSFLRLNLITLNLSNGVLFKATFDFYRNLTKIDIFFNRWCHLLVALWICTLIWYWWMSVAGFAWIHIVLSCIKFFRRAHGTTNRFFRLDNWLTSILINRYFSFDCCLTSILVNQFFCFDHWLISNRDDRSSLFCTWIILVNGTLFHWIWGILFSRA